MQFVIRSSCQNYSGAGSGWGSAVLQTFWSKAALSPSLSKTALTSLFGHNYSVAQFPRNPISLSTLENII